MCSTIPPNPFTSSNNNSENDSNKKNKNISNAIALQPEHQEASEAHSGCAAQRDGDETKTLSNTFMHLVYLYKLLLPAVATASATAANSSNQPRELTYITQKS